MKTYLSDFKVGIRQFQKSPGSLLFAVAAYAIGLGLVTLMLTMIFGVARGTPNYEKIDQMVTMRWDPATEHLWKNGNQFSNWRYVVFEDFEAEQTSFAHLSALRGIAFNVLLDGQPERVSGYQVTPDFFKALNAKPLMGRFFSNEDVRAEIERSVVISHSFWQNELKSDPDIVGKGLTLNGGAYTVLGVAREGFDFVSESQIWVPSKRQEDESRGVGQGHLVVGLLRDDVSLAQANAEFNSLAKRFQELYPDTNTGFTTVLFEPLGALYLPENIRNLFDVMLLCSVLVLLIACANVANILSTRMLGRTKELAIRSSLGAGRQRLVAQLLVEGLFIAILGGLGGWAVGEVTSKAVWNFVMSSDNVSLPSWMNVNIDFKELGLLFVATLVSSLLAGVLPALRASRTNVNEVLKDNSRTSSGIAIGRISKLLVVLQMSFSLGLLIAAGAMVKTVQAAQQYSPPYDTERMLIARIDLSGERYDTNQKKWAFYEELRQRLESIPGVRAAGFSSAYDLMYNWNSVMKIEGTEYDRREDFPRMRNEIVSNSYFEGLGISIIEGRGFTAFDVAQEEGNNDGVIVVNKFLADTYWPGQSPIGKRIRDTWDDEGPWLEVVGVVGETEMLGPGAQDEASRAGFYQPLGQRSWLSTPTVYLYAESDPLALVEPFRRAVLEIDPSLSPHRIKRVDTAVKDNQFGLYFFRNMFGLFGIGALILASVGIYGVMSFSVVQRTMEYGIRRSLGAPSSRVTVLIFRRGALQAGLGIVIGLLFGYALVGLVRQMIDEVRGDVMSFLVPTLCIVAISILALWMPSKRVNSVELADVLRES
ncbi:ADOP family duplicated permease [Pelagicoccus sp. SDUM812003]|uniref:ADOP family duplicated permease n=1 Tax=Pelagicoccus sp. SDUM812003 TaxID=3041267 RepID=UPI00280F8C43|nr:ADOP family duplicated permease [Pelagicoccus sp. SDUM812003]MDQ8204036.1 ADOP family duplicated permease [Pelagicoccus sp. SDUM812003]